MKIARIIPSFKSGDKQNVSSYRPISLLPQFSKTLKKIFNNHQHHWAAVVSRGWARMPQHAVSKLACRAMSSARSCRSSICPGRLSTAWLVSLVVFSCHNGLQVVTREVHRSSLRRLICPAHVANILFPNDIAIAPQ